MPTPQQTIDQQDQLISKLQATNASLENKYLLACKEIDLLTKHNNELKALISNYEILTSQLARPSVAQEGGAKVGSLVVAMHLNKLTDSPFNDSIKRLELNKPYTVNFYDGVNIGLFEVSSSDPEGTWNAKRFRELQIPPSLEAEIAECLTIKEPELV